MKSKERYMLREIFEIPEVLQRVAGFEFSPRIGSFLKPAKRIFLVGSGTSYHAGFLGRSFFEEIAGIEAEAWVASEWNLNPPEIKKEDLVILISQSGETAELISALKITREEKAKVLALVNRSSSTLAKKTDVFIDILAGEEKAVPATKSFVAEVMILLRLAILSGLIRKKINPAIFRGLQNDIGDLIGKTKLVLDRNVKIKVLALKYKNFQNFIVAGSGLTLPLAYELALKLKEAAEVHAEGMPLGEVRHGPMALADKKLTFIFLVDETDSVRAKNLALDLKKKGARVLAFDFGNFPASDFLVLPKCSRVLSPAVFAVAFQLFSYWLGVLRGYNVDKPRNLVKSVIAR